MSLCRIVCSLRLSHLTVIPAQFFSVTLPLSAWSFCQQTRSPGLNCLDCSPVICSFGCTVIMSRGAHPNWVVLYMAVADSPAGASWLVVHRRQNQCSGTLAYPGRPTAPRTAAARWWDDLQVDHLVHLIVRGLGLPLPILVSSGHERCPIKARTSSGSLGIFDGPNSLTKLSRFPDTDKSPNRNLTAKSRLRLSSYGRPPARRRRVLRYVC
jgi:hypothetical protein